MSGAAGRSRRPGLAGRAAGAARRPRLCQHHQLGRQPAGRRARKPDHPAVGEMARADHRRDERRGDRRGKGMGGSLARFPVCAALLRQFEFRAGNAGLPAQRRALRPGLSLCRGGLWRHADPLCLHPRGRGLSRAQPLGPGRYVSPPLRAHGKAGGAAARLRETAGADQDAGRRSRQMRREDLADPVHKTARRAPHVPAAAAPTSISIRPSLPGTSSRTRRRSSGKAGFAPSRSRPSTGAATRATPTASRRPSRR